jgi:hypothetical protein
MWRSVDLVWTDVSEELIAVCRHLLTLVLVRGFSYPEDGGDTFLRNVGSHDLQTPHPRIRNSSNYNFITEYYHKISIWNFTGREQGIFTISWIYFEEFPRPYQQFKIPTQLLIHWLPEAISSGAKLQGQASRPALLPTQLLIHWLPKAISSGVKRRGKRLDRLCCPPNSLSSGYRRLFPQGQSGRGVKLTTQLHLVPRSRMMEL